ncbi:pentapeptide MXKDX repeat protein [Agrobacterium tumefaciens]
MTIRLFSTAACAAVLGLSFATGAAQAQTNTDSMKKPDAMKTDTMSKDNMKMGSKADCMHKAGMEKDDMKKSDMMKTCDAMK